MGRECLILVESYSAALGQVPKGSAKLKSLL